MEDVRMSHAFDLKSLAVISPYVIRDRGFFLHYSVLNKWFQVVRQAQKQDNSETWCANFAKISLIAKWLCVGHHSFAIS